MFTRERRSPITPDLIECGEYVSKYRGFEEEEMRQPLLKWISARRVRIGMRALANESRSSSVGFVGFSGGGVGFDSGAIFPGSP